MMVEISRPCLGSRLTAAARLAGRDLWVLVEGGEAPHIGSVCLGQPRLSLTGDESSRATVSTFNLTGHKDDFIGNLFADRLTSHFKCTVSVSCGIHFDGLTPDKIQEVLTESEKLLIDLIDNLQNLVKGPENS